MTFSIFSLCPLWVCPLHLSKVRFGCGLGMERFERFRFSVPAVPRRRGVLCGSVQFSREDDSGSGFGSWKNGSGGSASAFGSWEKRFPDLDLSFLFCFFCPFWDFPDFSGIFPICSGMIRGFSRFVPFLFLGLLRAPTRNSPERVRDTIWTFPEKSGNPPQFGNSPV